MWNGVVMFKMLLKRTYKQHSTQKQQVVTSSVVETLSLLEIGQLLKAHFGWKFPFPRNELPEAAFKVIRPFIGFSRKFVELNMGYPIYFDANKSQKELGLKYRDVKEDSLSTFKQFLDDGVIKQYIP